MKRHILQILLSVSLLFCCGSLMSQGMISGTITDEANEPLIGANVIVKGTTDGTITDIDGNFSFNTNADFPVTLVVSFTGYSTNELILNNPSSGLNIVLSEGLLLTDDVVVSASRKREKVQEAPASVTVLSARKIESSPQSMDATRNLVSMPGVQIQQQSASRINISMRAGAGLFGTSVLPILDYRNLSAIGAGVFQSSRAGINTIDIERMEVVRGPGSALYGPGVTQGVVHFLSKSPIDYPGTTVELIGGELNTFGGSARIATSNANKTFGFKVNFSYKRGDEFTLDPNDASDAIQIAKFQNNIFEPIIGSDGYVTGQESTPRLTNLDEDNDGNPMQDYWNSLFGNITLEFRPSDNLNFTLAGGMNQGSEVFYNEQGEGLSQDRMYWGQARMQAGGFFGQLFYTHNTGELGDKPTFLYQTGLVTSIQRDQLEGQLQYNFDMPSFLNSSWTIGTDFRGAYEDTGRRVYGRNEDDDDFTVVGGYAQAKFALGKKFDLVGALRYDRFNFLDEGAFSPRAALVFKPSPQHTFRASFNRANSTVSNLQLNIDFPLATIIPNGLDLWLRGNKEAQLFPDNPVISWFNGLIPDLPIGAPGLPLGVPYSLITPQIIPLIEQSLSADPSLAPLVPVISQVLQNLDVNQLGFSGNLSPGFNIFNGTPLPIIDAPISAIATTDVLEFGYKGLIANKLGVSIDVYRNVVKDESSFTAISPVYRLGGTDALPADLGNNVQAAFEASLISALTPTLGTAQATAIAAGLGPIINQTYVGAGQGFMTTPSALLGGLSFNQILAALPFHAFTPTTGSPDDGIGHVGLGYRTFDEYSYWGSDIGMEYYISDNFSLFGNYSWINETEHMANVVGAENLPQLPVIINLPKNKYRLGLNYFPEYGLNASLSFQHDDEFMANAGQFSGLVQAKNIVDAGIGYKFENGLSLDITAQNVFDNEYRNYPNMPKIGRRVLGRLTYTLGAEGPSDIDGDGISDKKDLCPSIAGLKEYNGCPDSDLDGIIDSEDSCPNVAGPNEHGGCPDSDGDGVVDKMDDCPQIAGDLNGCPDADGDGVIDKSDNCPNVAGAINGCPDSDGDGVIDGNDACPNEAGNVGGCPDSDGDGVADNNDACPNEAGDMDNGCKSDTDGDGISDANDPCPNVAGNMNGCPDSDRDGIADNVDKCPRRGGVVDPNGCPRTIPASVVTTFNKALQGVQFNTAGSTLTSKSKVILDEVVGILTQYPNVRVAIEGHTDSVGAADRNLDLSSKRAKSVMQYLIDHGISGSRLSSSGYGESRPIADNNTAEGRKQNRRVELRAFY